MALLHPDVQLLGADREPDAAARAQGGRLLELPEAEQAAEEASRRLLAARRSRKLDVVESEDVHRFRKSEGRARRPSIR